MREGRQAQHSEVVSSSVNSRCHVGGHRGRPTSTPTTASDPQKINVSGHLIAPGSPPGTPRAECNVMPLAEKPVETICTESACISSSGRRRYRLHSLVAAIALLFVQGLAVGPGQAMASDGVWGATEVAVAPSASQVPTSATEILELPFADAPIDAAIGMDTRDSTEVPPAQTIPFAHRVGDRFRLRIERTVRERMDRRQSQKDSKQSNTFAADIDVEIVSLYGDGYVAELHWLALERGSRRVACYPPTAANAAVRDSVGGGVLRIAVQSDGTATSILNWMEVRDALARFHRARALRYQRETKKPVDLEAIERRLLRRAVVEPVLLGDWNQVYAACGVSLRPGETVTRRVDVPTTGGRASTGARATLPAVDVQDMDIYRNEHDAVVGLVYSSQKTIGTRSKASSTPRDRIASMLPGSEATQDIRVDERVLIHFDAETEMIHGTRRRDLHTGGANKRHVVETLRFSELPVPGAQEDVAPAEDDRTLARR